MSRAKWSGVAVVLTMGHLGAGCSSVTEAPPEAPHLLAKFPFDPNTKWIRLPVTFQDEQYSFTLDTGSSCTIFDDSFRDRLGKRFLLPKKVTAVYGERFTVECFHTPTAFVGPLKMNPDGLIAVADVAPIDMDPQVRTHGIVGMDFLKRYVVQIDPDRRTVSFFKSQKGVAHPYWGQAIRMKRKFRSSQPYVKAQVDGVKATFVVDTGFLGPLSGSLKSIAFEKVRAGSRTAEYHSKGATMAQPAESRSVSVVLPDKVCFDGLVCQDTAFREGYHSLLGLPFLSGYMVTFDFPNDKLYLRPARNQEIWGDGALKYANLGFSLSCQREGLSVRSVDMEGVGYLKGIRQNDLLLKIDGRDVSGFTMIDLARLLMQRPDNAGSLALTFKRGDAVCHVSFAASDLTPEESQAN